MRAAEKPVTVGAVQITVTVSGAYCGGPGESPARLLHRADKGLYQAKEAGRNQIGTAHLPAGVSGNGPDS